MTATTGQVDVVIVGGGTAGCVLAARLSENPERSVLLLESGPAPRTAGEFPRGVLDGASLGAAAPGNAVNWNHPAVLRRGRDWGLARGRILGGSSAINGGYLVRPRREDAQRWAVGGGPRWSWDAILPLLRRIETDLDYGSSPVHGGAGPLPVRRASTDHPVQAAAVAAARSLGLPDEPDKNDQGLPGVGPVPLSVIGGRRISAAIAYLLPVIDRPNLHVHGDATVERVLIRRGRAVGVTGSRGTEVAAGEVILCAGAFGSPAILLRSGVGPRSDLERLGIDVVHDAAGVGAGISDHPQLTLDWRPAGPLPPAGTSWMGALVNQDPNADGRLELVPSSTPISRLLGGDDGPLSVLVADHTPRRRGRLRLRRSDPVAPPEIDLGYLADARDRRMLRAAARFGVDLLESEPFRHLVGERIGPNPGILRDDAELDAWVAAHLGTSLHSCGTVPFGAEEQGGVVDGTGRVHGVEGLRVADTSILPTAPVRGPALAAYLVGELVAADPRA